MAICRTLVLHGSEEQKRRYLPGVASGEVRFLTVAATEPDSGANMTELASTARRDGDDWVLNASKGPAVRATRAQADRVLYRQAVRRALENQPGLQLFQQEVADLVVEGERVRGVVTAMGQILRATTVVLTVGTFLGGRIHIGPTQYAGGRAGDPPANALATRLRELPLRVERLKTGTPPRLDGRSIDYTQLQAQPGDEPRPVMSFLGSAAEHPRQVDCHITRTNAQTHDIISNGLHDSPLYSGAIAGTGPRYCPSIEDKVVRFADKASHQIFVEPEGLDTHEVYPNGISTSLSWEVQQALVHSIEGFEKAHITRPGYAIEYDFFDPRDLRHSLETQVIAGLYFAGQINGTTGYEEAAAQGLLAGLNAALKARDGEPWCPRRDEAYIGVLVDDLCRVNPREPYRMFTSRAEHRLYLRQGNADLRLSEQGEVLWSWSIPAGSAIDQPIATIRTVASARRDPERRSARRSASTNATPSARANASSLSTLASPTPRLGVLRIRFSDTSSAGFTTARR